MYAQWSDGKIVGDCTYPNRLTEQTPVNKNSQEWIDYMSKVPARKGSIDLTEQEKAALIDFYEANKIISTGRARSLRGSR